MLIAKRRERLEDRRQLVGRALGFRREVPEGRAVAGVDDARACARGAGGRPGTAVSAGTMLSRNGSAIAAPRPRSTVRRGIAIFVMIMTCASHVRSRRVRVNRRPVRIWNGVALRDAQNDRRPAVIGGRRVPHDLPDRRHVVGLDAPADRVGHQLFGHGPDELAPARPQHEIAQAARAVDRRGRRAARPSSRPACPPSIVAPPADRVELLEREPQRIHHGVAARARRILPVLLHPLAHRARLLAARALGQIGHVGRRRRRRRVRACSPAATCRGRPATCGWERRSPSGCSPARAARPGAPRAPRRAGSGCRTHSGMP